MISCARRVFCARGRLRSGASALFMKVEPGAKQKDRSRPARLIFWISIPLFFLSTAYYYAFSTRNVEKFVHNLVEDNTGATLRWNVRRSSLLYGLQATDIVLSVRETGTPLLRIDRLNLSFFLPSALAGHVGVRELSLTNVRLYLIERDGEWNWSRAFPSSEESDDKPETELPESIRLPVSVLVYLNLVLDNFSLFLDRGDEQSLAVENVNLRLGVITRPFSEIPLNLSMIELFESLILALNPTSPMRISLKAGRTIQGPVTLGLFLFRQEAENSVEFSSRLNLDTSGMEFRTERGAIGRAPLNLYYDLAFDSPRDRLIVQELRLSHQGERWLFLQARVDRISSPERSLALRVEPSRIELGRLGQALAAALGTGSSLPIDGRIEIRELDVQGGLTNLLVRGRIEGSNLSFASGDRKYEAREVGLDVTARLDAYPVLPFVRPPPDYVPDPGLAFGLFHELAVPDLRLAYGRAFLSGNVDIRPETGVQTHVNLLNLPLQEFLSGHAEGFLSGNLDLFSPESFEKIGFQTDLHLREARYFVDRSRSGYQTLNLSGRGLMDLGGDAFKLRVDGLNLRGRNVSGESMLELAAGGSLEIGESQTYSLRVDRLAVNYPALRPALPGSIRYQIAPFQIYLSEPVSLSSSLRLTVNSERVSLYGDSRFEVPFLHLDDLEISNSLHFESDRIRVERVQLRGLRGALAGNLTGEFRTAGENYIPRMDLDLRIARDSLLPVHENIALQGSIVLRANVNNERATGHLGANGVNVVYSSNGCSQATGPDCKQLFISGMELNLPFQHDLTGRTAVHVGNNPGAAYTRNFGQVADANLIVRSVRSSHNPRGEYVPANPFYFLGAPEGQGEPGIAARLDYRRNVLVADDLRVRMYRPGETTRWVNDGSIDSRELYFNLANLSPENMELSANLQIKNLNLEPFLPPSKASYDGIVSADARIESHNLAAPLFNSEAYLSVHRISPEFSGFVTRIIMPARVVAFVIRNSLEIPAIRVELKGGLVYSYIQIRRARLFPGIFISPGGDEIRQERMPLAQFLDRARSEVEDFGERGVAQPVEQ